MTIDTTHDKPRQRIGRLVVDPDIGDRELIDFALGFAGPQSAMPTAKRLLADFGDIDVLLATDPEVLRQHGGLSTRAVAILKLLAAFRGDSGRAMIH